jgi:predicted acylesterase/phospholipase RssA
VNGYADGGIVDNYPLFDALAHKVDRVIMFVTAAVDPKPINNAKDMLAESFSILLYNQLQVALRSLSLFEHDTEVIVIQVPHTTGIPLLNFSGLGSIGQRKHYIDNGYELAKEILKDIKP